MVVADSSEELDRTGLEGPVAVIWVVAEELGASLRRATATTTRATRSPSQ
jgi:hypothetical protein